MTETTALTQLIQNPPGFEEKLEAL